MREKLIELIIQGKSLGNCLKDECTDCFGEHCSECEIGDIADHLLANEEIKHAFELLKAEKEGRLIVPPCKVGDKLYYISYRVNGEKTEKYIKEETIEMISVDSLSIYAHIPRALVIDLADLGKTVFLSREGAEKALAERKDNESKIE